MNIARVIDGFVVNIEVADEEWVAAHDGINGATFVPFGDDPREADDAGAANSPHIGLRFDAETGLFEQPMVEPR